MTPPLNLEKKIPLFLGQYATTYLAFLAVFILWFIFNKTVAGLRLQSAGENPNAALAAGIKIHRYQYAGVLLSSFMAGLGGASLSIAIVSNFRIEPKEGGTIIVGFLLESQDVPEKVFGKLATLKNREVQITLAAPEIKQESI